MIYNNLQLTNRDPFDDRITSARSLICNDIQQFGSANDQKMLYWFSNEKWTKNKFTNSIVIHDEHGEVVALCGNILLNDNTLKILCHFYVLKKFRSMYQSVHQVLMIPNMVEYGMSIGATGLWYSFDPYDNRHKRYSESQKRLLNGSNVPTNQMPYWDKFEFVGQVTYNNTLQDKFYMNLVY